MTLAAPGGVTFGTGRSNAENEYRFSFELPETEISQAIYFQTMGKRMLWLWLRITDENANVSVYFAGVAQHNGCHQNGKCEYVLHLLSNVESIQLPHKQMKDHSFEVFITDAATIDETKEQLGIGNGGAIDLIDVDGISFELKDEREKKRVGRPAGTKKKAP